MQAFATAKLTLRSTPQRQRMVENKRMRKFEPKTQSGYLRHCQALTAWQLQAAARLAATRLAGSGRAETAHKCIGETEIPILRNARTGPTPEPRAQMSVVNVQGVGSPNRYTEPESTPRSPSRGAPAMTSRLESATERPRMSLGAASEATSLLS